jgi:Na+/H+ antiporter NhaA
VFLFSANQTRSGCKAKAQKAIDLLREFHKLECASGLLLIGATVAALLLANIAAASQLYEGLLALHLMLPEPG